MEGRYMSKAPEHNIISWIKLAAQEECYEKFATNKDVNAVDEPVEIEITKEDKSNSENNNYFKTYDIANMNKMCMEHGFSVGVIILYLIGKIQEYKHDSSFRRLNYIKVTQTQIVKEVKLNKHTVIEILKKLEEINYIIRLPKSRIVLNPNYFYGGINAFHAKAKRNYQEAKNILFLQANFIKTSKDAGSKSKEYKERLDRLYPL